MKLRKCVNCHVLAFVLCAGMAVDSAVVAAADETVKAERMAAPESAVAPASAVAASAPAIPTFARVNGKAITAREYVTLYNDTMRKRYYHAKPPESEELAARQEVADILVERELLVEEAEKRGLKADESKIEKATADMDRRYGVSPQWKDQRERALSAMRAQVTRESQIEQITKILHQAPEATAAEVRAYYEQHPDLFTEPEQLRLSVITLKVDPSSTSEVWAKAREEAKALRDRIVGGEDFAEVARKYSQDKSAERGGDLGYLHRGMLPETLSKRVDGFKVDEVSAPLSMLEGVSLFLVKDRIAPKLREFDAVESRARDLLQKERGENAWKEAIAKLRAAAKIEILIPLK